MTPEAKRLPRRRPMTASLSPIPPLHAAPIAVEPAKGTLGKCRRHRCPSSTNSTMSHILGKRRSGAHHDQGRQLTGSGPRADGGGQRSRGRADTPAVSANQIVLDEFRRTEKGGGWVASLEDRPSLSGVTGALHRHLRVAPDHCHRTRILEIEVQQPIQVDGGPNAIPWFERERQGVGAIMAGSEHRGWHGGHSQRDGHAAAPGTHPCCE